MKLRDYQLKAVNDTLTIIKRSAVNPIIALPTGTGKSAVCGGLINELYDMPTKGKLLMLTHNKKLIEQNFQTLLRIRPTIDAGINCAGLHRRDNGAQVVYASIQSVHRQPDQFGLVSAIVIDECHLVSPNIDTTYRRFIAALRAKNPGLRVVGLSATPYRMGLGYLTEGPLFDTFSVDLTHGEKFTWFIKQGFLSPLVPRPMHTTIDLQGVRLSGGEFRESDLQKATDQEAITDAAIPEVIHFGRDRKKWLIFGTGIDHCEHIRDALTGHGIKCVVTHSRMSEKEQDDALVAHRLGHVQAIINADQLTTGYDDPEIDLIVALRATNSPGLWCQMLGRGTRPVYAEGYDLSTKAGRLAAIADGPKQDCLVLDFPKNSERLGPVNNLQIPKPAGTKKRKTRRAPVKVCESCETYQPAGVRTCQNCGVDFPRKTRLTASASTAILIEQGAEIETHEVVNVRFKTRKKKNGPDMLLAEYDCGPVHKFTKYLCFDHPPQVAGMAKKWWKEHTMVHDFTPGDVKTAFNHVANLKKPVKLVVRTDQKHVSILEWIYA